MRCFASEEENRVNRQIFCLTLETKLVCIIVYTPSDVKRFYEKGREPFPIALNEWGRSVSLLSEGGGYSLDKGSFDELAESWFHEVIFSSMGNPKCVEFDPPLWGKTGGWHLRFNLRRRDEGAAQGARTVSESAIRYASFHHAFHVANRRIFQRSAVS